MFKWFTWTKAAGWLGVAAAILTGPGGLILGIPATTVGAISAILAGISSLITTSKAGTATNAAGDQINGNLPK